MIELATVNSFKRRGGPAMISVTEQRNQRPSEGVGPFEHEDTASGSTNISNVIDQIFIR